jgi:hypothetical protein
MTDLWADRVSVEALDFDPDSRVLEPWIQV